MSNSLKFVLRAILTFTITIGVWSYGYLAGFARVSQDYHLKCAKASLIKFEGDNAVYGCALIPQSPKKKGVPTYDKV